MIDNRILLSRLHISVGITGLAFNFIQSYLSGRRQCFRTSCNMCVPQGSVLGPILFPAVSHKSAILLLTSTFSYNNMLTTIFNYSYQPLSTPSKPISLSSPFKPVSPIYSLASQHPTLGSPTIVLYLSLKLLLSAPGWSFELVIPVLAFTLQAPMSHYLITLKSHPPDSHLTCNSYMLTVCKSAFYQARALRLIENPLSHSFGHGIDCKLTPVLHL